MGFEIRRDVVFPIGDVSAMLLPNGSEERFIQAFAPGASTGYLVLMDHGADNKPSHAPTLGPPQRGIVMWSFRTKDMDEFIRRVEAQNVPIVQPLTEMNVPGLGPVKSIIVNDPGGFPMEIYQDIL